MTSTLHTPDGDRFVTSTMRRYVAVTLRRDHGVDIDARSDSLATAKKRCYKSGFVVDRLTDTVVYVGPSYRARQVAP